MYGFVERYVASLNSESAQKFMKFVSGCETSQKPITVIFNSVLNPEQMVPKSHTCSGEPEVSRYIGSFEVFQTMMDNILKNIQARSGFHFAWSFVLFLIFFVNIFFCDVRPFYSTKSRTSKFGE